MKLLRSAYILFGICLSIAILTTGQVNAAKKYTAPKIRAKTQQYPCATYPTYRHTPTTVPITKPTVQIVNHRVVIDNRCNQQGALVVIYQKYESHPGSETFQAERGRITTQPRASLHSGEIKVWVRYTDEINFLYTKQM